MFNDLHIRGFMRMNVIAVLSVVALMGVIGWSMFDAYQQKQKDLTVTPVSRILSTVTADPSESNSLDEQASEALIFGDVDPITTMSQNAVAQLAGNYLIAKQEGTYNAQKANEIASQVTPLLQAPVYFTRFTESEVITTTDVSYDRMIRYRTDLQVSLNPLLKNSQAEFEIFALYTQTKNTKYLDELRLVASRYNEAASSTKKVTAPIDAASYHVGIVNAMLKFAATLEAMADHANDPVASAALLHSYNQAEQDMLTSFDSLSQYYVHKKK